MVVFTDILLVLLFVAAVLFFVGFITILCLLGIYWAALALFQRLRPKEELDTEAQLIDKWIREGRFD